MLHMKSFEIRWNEIPEESYLRDISALKGFVGMKFHKNVTLFCGENGTGKSTILRALAEAWGLNPHGGTKNYLVDEDHLSELSGYIDLEKGNRICFRAFLRADSYLEMMSDAEQRYEFCCGERCVNELSHGESFRAFLDSLRPGGLYFLDEPDGAFSARNLLVFMSKIIDLVNHDSQFVIATHSPLLLGLPDAEIYCFGEEGISLCDYEFTEAYQITKAFLNDRERMLRYLCEE
ncbi:MAG: AAA family ATPase [Firmicutes bacterium]|nr:AAA family ATPase [Bacillota bacterium]